MGTFAQDLRYAVRVVARNPGLTLVVIVSLALGIGANSAIFSVVNSLLLRPLPVPDPDEIAVVYMKDHHGELLHGPSYRDAEDYRKQTDLVFSGLALVAPVPLNISAGNQNERVWGELVSGNYFTTLRLQPSLGRGFLPEEDGAPGAHPVVVISHRLWVRRFGSDPSAIGRTIELNGHDFTIVGVTPAAFNSTFYVGFVADLWVPAWMHAQAAPGTDRLLTDRNQHAFKAIARLRPGVRPERAEASLNTVAQQLGQAFPGTNKGVTVRVIREIGTRPEPEVAGRLRLAALVLMAVVGLVLLVACANVANLLLARATTRQREMAVRLALGAARGRLLRQLLTESLLVAIAGGAAGLLVGVWGSRLLGSITLPTDIPVVFDLRLDANVLAFTAAVSLVTGIMFGLAPALQASSPSLLPALKGDSMGAGSAPKKLRLLDLLVVGQVAVSLLLLVCAGLFVRSLQSAQRIDPGFDPGSALLASVDVGLQGYDETRGRAFFRQLEQRIATLPGVRNAALAHYVPMDFYGGGGTIVIEGRAAKTREEEQVGVMWAIVGPGYFRTMRTPIVAGREFTPGDDQHAPRVVIVNELAARRFWPGLNALGRRLRLDGPQGPVAEVVGVARDGKYRLLGEDPREFLFLPMLQHYRSDVQIVARSAGDPMSLEPAVRREIQAMDPSLPLYAVSTLEHLVAGRSLLGPRLMAALVGVFGLLGLTLAAVGLSGVVAYSVSRRTREMGVRMALGADRGALLRMVLRQGLKLSLIGLALGLVAALALGRVLSSLLYDVTPTDPLTLAGMGLVLVAVTLAASYIPARRAANVDPMIALRYE